MQQPNTAISYCVPSNMTYKPSKLGQTDLILGLWPEFISRSVHTGVQVSMCSGYDLCHPG